MLSGLVMIFFLVKDKGGCYRRKYKHIYIFAAHFTAEFWPFIFPLSTCKGTVAGIHSD